MRISPILRPLTRAHYKWAVYPTKGDPFTVPTYDHGWPSSLLIVVSIALFVPNKVRAALGILGILLMILFRPRKPLIGYSRD